MSVQIWGGGQDPPTPQWFAMLAERYVLSQEWKRGVIDGVNGDEESVDRKYTPRLEKTWQLIFLLCVVKYVTSNFPK